MFPKKRTETLGQQRLHHGGEVKKHKWAWLPNDGLEQSVTDLEVGMIFTGG